VHAHLGLVAGPLQVGHQRLHAGHHAAHEVAEAREGSPTGALLFYIVTLGVLITTFTALGLYACRHRFKPVEQQMSVRSTVHGRPMVVFQPMYWSFDETPPVMRNLRFVPPHTTPPPPPAITSLWR
jgi:hypothetical protein